MCLRHKEACKMTDESLALKAKNGDEIAMNELLTSYKTAVTRQARSYFLIGGDMEDIVQEGMIGLYKAIISFNPDRSASFKTFASVCIKHQIQSAIKVASSEKNKILSSALPIWEQSEVDDEYESRLEILIPSNLPSPDDKVIAHESLQELKKKIKQTLSPLEIKVLNLYLKGYSYSEISDVGDISKKSIDNALTRIKNKLTFLKKAE